MGANTHRQYRISRAVVALTLLAMTFAPLAGGNTPPTAHAQNEVTWLFEQINALRAGLGLHLYSLNPQLSAAAQQHSQYMADTCDISHTEANGSTATTRARANGYTGNWISENIYGGRGVEYAWNFWINSGIHYQGLTHEIVNEIGIGVAYGSCGQGYTLVFGHRDNVNAPPAAPAVAAAPEAVAEAAAAPPPTAVPYVPPPPTSTPTPTIPTLTPSSTWTITPTPTTSPEVSATARASTTATATPLVLPTVPALEADPLRDDDDPAAGVAVAQQPSASPTPRSTETVTATITQTRPATVTRTVTATTTATTTATATATATPERAANNGANASGDSMPGWLPPLLLAGAGILGVAGVMILRRAR